MKTLGIIKYAFALVGIGMSVGAMFLYTSTSSFIRDAARAEGTVVDLVRSRSSDSTTYRPVVRFVSQSGEHIEFTSSAGSNPPSYSGGEKVEVLYRPVEPQNAKINGFFSLWGGAVIVGGLGAVFFLIGGGILLFGALKGRKQAYLKKHGTPIDTELQGVKMNTALSVNGRHPFQVVTQWLNPATSQVHVFRSNNLWFDPSSYINVKQIKVYIERNNPKNYYVDLSFLPKMAE